MNRPKARARHNAHYGRDEHRIEEKRTHAKQNATEQEAPPAFDAKIVFSFYHYGVEESDGEKCYYSQQQSTQMISFYYIHCFML